MNYELPANRIVRELQAGRLTATEVAETFLARINALNPRFSAWIHLDEDYVLAQARQVDAGARNGLLAGVPVGVKDIFNTEVFPTEMGSALWKGHKAGNDARCVSNLRREGALIAGKTDTAEFAVHTPGNALNPWNELHVTGTSSGGSAVAVATAMAPAALATQTAGSTIRPASWCGIYGMKPSFGVIPRTGVLKTTDTLDNIGFYGRDTRDLELLLDSMRVRGHNFPIMEKRFSAYAAKPRNRWRVAFIRGHLWDKAPEYTRNATRKAVNELSNIGNIELVELELPESTQSAHQLHRRIYNPCLAYYFKDELARAPELISDSFMALVEDGKTLSPEDYRIALQAQAELAHDLEYWFSANNVDFAIHFSSNGSAPVHEPDTNEDINLLWTLSWLPVVNIPRFVCPKGLPYGLQVIGPRYSDYRMFNFLELLVEQNIAPEIAPVADPLMEQTQKQLRMR